MTERAQLSFSEDTLYVEGIVDFSTVVDLQTRGDLWLRNTAPQTCRLDLSKVVRCNSAATTLLLCWLRTAQRLDKQLLIGQVPAALRSLMDLGGLESLLPTG